MTSLVKSYATSPTELHHTTSEDLGRGRYWKQGSLQELVPAADCASDYSSSQFSVCHVQRTGLFDVCVMNLDRNDGNLLVAPYVRRHVANRWVPPHKRTRTVEAEKKRLEDEIRQEEVDMMGPKGSLASMVLYPIDHGLTFPDSLDVTTFDWVWFHWPQAKMPFGSKELKVIAAMNPDRDVEILSKHFDLRSACFRTYRVCCRLVKRCAMMHLNLHQIASIAARTKESQPSILELLIQDSIRRTFAMSSNSIAKAPLMTTSALDLATTERFPTKVSFAESESESEESVSDSGRHEDSFATDDLRAPLTQPSEDIVFKHSSDSRTTSFKAESRFNSWTSPVPPSTVTDQSFPALHRTRTIGHDVDGQPDEISEPLDDEEQRARNFFMSQEGGSEGAEGLRLRIKRGDVQLSKLTGLPITGAVDSSAFQQLMAPGEGTDGFTSRHASRLSLAPSLLQASSSFANRRSKRMMLLNIKEDRDRLDSVWTMQDEEGRRIRYDWTPQFDSIFFAIINHAITHCIRTNHPEWQRYPWSGTAAMADPFCREEEITQALLASPHDPLRLMNRNHQESIEPPPLRRTKNW
ncbi:MAG: uncharacterized protein KVP18_003084 [Porospora cf. gigantea A]|uniref:uncharacterized protein n=1 Tax=Porospora cf. gigantea A TaxID=2853593 RepID=UPI00355A4737|nr:MAG: hypothetical protein KVP18_003084 [Porospora cf. gigantea A]